MASVFGDHALSIPYSPIAELFAHHRARDPDKTAIVDLDSGSSITFGELDRLTTDIAALLKRQGVVKQSRVMLLSEEGLNKIVLRCGV
jgi:long-chain acyl-CoA synthetase/malonyl-CoA/methylmalonyl-CoA synthetase